MSHSKKHQGYNFIDKNRRQKIKQAFNALTLINQTNWLNSSYSSEGCNALSKKFFLLKNKKTTVNSTNNIG